MAKDETTKLSEEMTGLRADFAKIAETLTNFVRQRAEEAAAKFHDSTEQPWCCAKHSFEDVKKKIQDEPVTASLVALGIGLILGLLLSGGRCCKPRNNRKE